MSLEGLRILNTRPADVAAGLSSALVNAGAELIELPLIAIKPVSPLTPEAHYKLMELDRYDYVFFVSQHAAKIGLSVIDGYWTQWPYQLPAIAVGQSTAAVLEQAGLHVITPAQEDSEGVLALPELAEASGLDILIIRGVGGRELLAQSLREQGANVDIVELYERVPPSNLAFEWATLRDNLPEVVILSSPAIWHHWQQLAGTLATEPWLLTVSPRLRDEVIGAGGKVIEAAGARTEQIISALKDWRS